MNASWLPGHTGKRLGEIHLHLVLELDDIVRKGLLALLGIGTQWLVAQICISKLTKFESCIKTQMGNTL